MMKLPTTLTKALTLGLLFTPSLAFAHLGHSSGLTGALAHPFSGLDHLVVMLGVGLWAAQLGGRARVLVPLAFFACMVLGAVLGVAGIALGGIEQGIGASVLMVGLLLVGQYRVPNAVGALLGGGFAIFHGVAHGRDIPMVTEGGVYVAGFLASTAVLLLCGVSFGMLARESGRPWVRFAGAAVTICGVLNLSLLF